MSHRTELYALWGAVMADTNALVRELMEKGYTRKQSQAMRAAIEADGRYKATIANCKKYGVSEGYLRDLFYADKHVKWQFELKRRLVREKPTVDELDEQYVIRRLMELTGSSIQDTARLGALNSLAKILGMFAPQEMVLRVEDMDRVKELGLEKEVAKELKQLLDGLGVVLE